MAYVLTDGGNIVVTYPYNVGLLRRDNPTVSFPASPTNEQLAAWNVFPVTPTAAPSYDVINENLAEVNPTGSGASWTQAWSVTPATSGEIADRTAEYAASANAEAARRLAETEQYWIKAFEDGTALHADFLAYRAALQNPSALSGYPVSPAWPTFPVNIYDSSDVLPIPVYDKTYIDGLASSFTTAIGLKADTTTVNTALADKLALSGGTMTGEIDMGFSKIVGLANPEWPQDAAHKQYVDDAIAGLPLPENFDFLPLAGGLMTGDIDLQSTHKIINVPTPLDAGDATSRQYVDNSISTAIAPLALQPRLTLNLQTSTGSITTDPVIASAMTTIGATNGYTVNLGFGEYRETGPILIDNKSQLQLNGNRTAGTTSATIKNGITIQNSNGVRLHTVQVEGTSSISCRAGLGIYAERSQFMGNVTLDGTGGFMMFIDCDFAGNVTIPNTFAGTVYFVRCSFSNASGVYTFSQTSPLQAIISESNGIPNTPIANASYSGLITYKAGAQAMFVNGLPLYFSGTTAARPATATTGFMYFDTTLNKPIWRSGASWRDATGTIV